MLGSDKNDPELIKYSPYETIIANNNLINKYLQKKKTKASIIRYLLASKKLMINTYRTFG